MVKNNLREQLTTQSVPEQACMEEIEEALRKVIDSSFPLKRCRVNNKKPWINEFIYKEIDRKRRYWDKYRQSRDHADYLTYRMQNNTLKKLIKKSRQQYEEKLLEKSDKHFYNYIKRNLSSHISELTLKNPQSGEIVTDPQQTADLFSERFAAVFTEEDMQSFPTLPQNDRSKQELNNIEITDEKIIQAIKSLKKDSSPGPDGIPSILLINCAEILAPYMASAMRKILTNNAIPPSWREAYVIPIFKKGDRLNPLNYRPVNLTCHSCKILEKVIAPQMTEFLLDNKVIPPEQHGFLPKRSTTTNLLKCINQWSAEMDKGNPVDILYLDFQKAFDTVPINRLLYKLDHLGIRGNLLQWIESFLKHRTFKVRANGSYSTSREVKSGVVQGSVLGPLLFVAYIGDLSNLIKVSISLFADDTKMYCNPLKDVDQFNQDIQTLETWTRMWQLRLNEEKCMILQLGRNNPQFIYNINGVQLQRVSMQKDLGVYITNNLKWDAHISHIVKKANTMIYLIQKTFANKSITTISKIYKTYIRPKLEYANVVWNPYYIKDIELLERVQRRVTKIPLELKLTGYTERLQRFNLSTLKKRRDRGDMIEVYKILTGYYDRSINMPSLFQYSTNAHLRGHSKKLKKEKSQTLFRKNLLTNRSVYRWNGLQEDTVVAPNINTFKNRLDKELETNRNALVHYF